MVSGGGNSWLGEELNRGQSISCPCCEVGEELGRWEVRVGVVEGFEGYHGECPVLVGVVILEVS